MRKVHCMGFARLVSATIAFATWGAAPQGAPAQMMVAEDFAPIVDQGFGDRYNSYPWSMKWWNGKLYVGTLRSMYCVQQATLVRWIPRLSFLYPPWDPDFACTDDPADLPLQGEIWRWTPETGVWDLLYRSPADVPVPGDPTRTVAREIGFRTMTLYTEADGTEALYAGSFCTESFLPGVNVPSLLRSTDGETFHRVPQDPGTFLGSLTLHGFPYNGFRSLQTYDDRIFVVASEGFLGSGGLIESDDPSAGNDAWGFAAPPDQVFYQLATYNGYLYAGQADSNGFFLVKTDAQGAPPYEFEVVIPQGGYLTPNPSQAVVSLFEYDGFLYVGLDRPPEIYRVNPDDSWELVAGEPRRGPNGVIRPTSGLGAGFDNQFALHTWRMQDAYGVLYTGTMDQTTKWSLQPPSDALYAPTAGFDLYGTQDGYYYTMVTRNGLSDKYNEGLRQFAFAPEHGLIMGAVNNRFGCNIWRAVPNPALQPAPRQLDSEEELPGWVLLSWGTTPGAVQYRVYRSLLAANDRSYHQIATTFEPYFSDGILATESNPAHYYVVAVGADGTESKPSNVLRAPFLGKRPNFVTLRQDLVLWGASPEVLAKVDSASALFFRSHDYRQAVLTLLDALSTVRTNPDAMHPSWRGIDADAALSRMARRAQIVNRGFLPWWWLLF